MPARKNTSTSRTQSTSDDAWKQDLIQADNRKENKLNEFSSTLETLVDKATSELVNLQTRYEAELQGLRRAQVSQLDNLLKQKNDIEMNINQSSAELNSAYRSMNHELQITLGGRHQECSDQAIDMVTH